MRPIDLATQGRREAELLAVLRRGAVRSEDVETVTPPFFSKIQIQTTSLCNAACTTCPYPDTSRELSMGEMSEEVFSSLVEQIRGRGVERVSLFLMNEPTVDKRLEAFTRQVRRRVPGAVVTIITNGALLSAARARSLAEAGMGEITVSVNGFTAEAYGSTMVGLRFDRILRNLAGIGAAWRAGDLGEMDLRITALEIGDAREQAREFADRVGIPVHLKPVSNRAGSIDVGAVGGQRCPTTPGARSICQRPFVKAYVLFNGDMVLCNCDWRRTTILGNVRDRTLEEMWRGARLMEVRRHHVRGSFPADSPCAKCDYPYLIEE